MYNKRKMGKEIGNVLWFDQKKGFGINASFRSEAEASEGAGGYREL